MSKVTVNETTDRYGRPLLPDPEATRLETDPVGVHVIPMHRDAEYRFAAKVGAGVGWTDRGRWRTEHMLHVPVRGDSHARWTPYYLDDTSLWNVGPGQGRRQGRHLFVVQDSSVISSHPEMGTAAEIRRKKAAGQWHEAKVGDLVVLECREDDGDLVETIAARIVPAGWGGSHIDLMLVQR